MLWVSEVFANKTDGYTFGESEPYETYTDSVGSLFRSLRSRSLIPSEEPNQS